MTTLHQVVPILHEGDAVGSHTVFLHADLLRGRGVDSDIFSVFPDPRTVRLTGLSPSGPRPSHLPNGCRLGTCRPPGDAAGSSHGQLPQHHPSSLLRRLGPPTYGGHVCWSPAAGADCPARRPRDRGLILQCCGLDHRWRAGRGGARAFRRAATQAGGRCVPRRSACRRQAGRLCGLVVRRPGGAEQGPARRHPGVCGLPEGLRAHRPSLPRRFRGLSDLQRCTTALVDGLRLSDAVQLVGGVHTPRYWRRTTRQPTCSSACRSTKGSASPSSRRCNTACPLSPMGRDGVGETLGGSGILLTTKEPTVVAAAAERALTGSRLTRLKGVERLRALLS